MAYSESAQIASFVAGATFNSTSLYKFVVVDSSGHVVLPNTTGNVLPVGVLYGRTSTTSAAGSQAVPVAIGGIAKVRMSATTLASGDFIASTTAGLGAAATTDAYVAGQIISGTSGAGIVTAKLLSGPLSTP